MGEVVDDMSAPGVNSAYYAAILSGACCAALLLDMSVRYIIPRFRRKTAVKPKSTAQETSEKINVAEVAPSLSVNRKVISKEVTSKVMSVQYKTDNRKALDATDSAGGVQTDYSLLNLQRGIVHVDTKEVNKLTGKKDVPGRCLDLLSVLSELEMQFMKLSHGIDTSALKASGISNTDEDEISPDPALMVSQAMACTSAARSQWSSLRTLLYCLDVHMHNASNYQMFVLEAVEYEKCLTKALNKLTTSFDIEDKRLEKESIEIYIQQVQQAKDTLTFWEGIVNDMTARSGAIIPLPQRINKSETAIPVKMLCNFKTNSVEIKEGEQLNLIDASEYPKWKVKTLAGFETTVPAICCLVSPPDGNVINTVNRLRIKLCVMIALSVKALGKYLIWLNTSLQNDWNEKSDKVRCVSEQQKEKVTCYLTDLMAWMEPYWERYARFGDLQSSVKTMQNLLQESKGTGDGSKAADFHADMVNLESGFKDYKELWSKWEIFRAMVDASSHPELILMADKWEQMKLVSPQTFLKYWHTELNDEEIVDAEKSSQVGINVQRESSTAEASEYSEEAVEVKETFSITGVIDPKTKEKISVQDATSKGIINQREGKYVNTMTGETIHISEAMTQGLIVVESVKSKKLKEEKIAVGVLKVTIQRETRPYTITKLKDPVTDDEMSVDDAIGLGIFDKENGFYVDTTSGKKLSVADAIDVGNVIVEFDSEAEKTPPEIITKTYAIHNVLDRKRKKRIAFVEAVDMAIINPNTGSYKDAISGEEIGIAEAMKKGLVKAEIVPDDYD